MLDHVSISHQSGLILWSRSFTPTFSALALTPSSPVNALIKEAFIEGKVRNESEGIERDGYSVRWTIENGLGLIFVVVFPALLPLTYIPALLHRVKQLFLSLFSPYLRSLVDSLTAGSIALTESSSQALKVIREKLAEERWEKIFDRCLKSFEGQDSRKQVKSPVSLRNQAQLASVTSGESSPAESDDSSVPLSAEEISKNVQSMKSRIKRGRASRGGTASPVSSPKKAGGSSAAASKLMRKWGDSPVTKEDMAALDYSAPAPGATSKGEGGLSDSMSGPVDTEGMISNRALGKRTANGYEVADWDYRGDEDELPTEDEILANGTSKLSIGSSSIRGDETKAGDEGGGLWGNMFARLTGTKVLTQEDLKPVLVEMEKHLMGKNVAKDIAEKLCDSVGSALVGKKLSGLASVKSEVQSALSASLTRVLTPKTSTDILLEIQRKRSPTATIATPDAPPEPYAMTFVGVNGVGKSTNLSKVCFWLLQNGLRVLIAACDTFRSGAVEQLRVHVRNLGALQDEMGLGDEDGGKKIELYERGYGKDAAGIAKDAIAYAKSHRFDVVLIDTAGRMQDNEPLMRALAKLVTVNNPDKIIFVGEALVGNEAVDQLTKFDRALRDFSSSGIGGAQRKRGIDGILLTKFDTIDDKVGAALSMTYVTGQPILFVGCGQTYTDLRHLRVPHIVNALLNS
ncbi:putative signal recognition particle binding protein [Kockovaella imperatae]|uniref:Putative signal recognition particle binding protein n=1 Tax=Kockovaella imperatae TaxID=4999 RepID=A0A1Y1UTT7_9TREE|nr:putative signal recognition particle binding protein [Kockovaella imperatae]ORX40944.1 putative signal recognition particle binding protein [Kockovaella imperatae]